MVPLMRLTLGGSIAMLSLIQNVYPADFTPAPQHFRQEVARRFSQADGLPAGAVQLIDCAPDNITRVFASGAWYQFRDDHWEVVMRPGTEQQFAFVGPKGERLEVPLPWGD